MKKRIVCSALALMLLATGCSKKEEATEMADTTGKTELTTAAVSTEAKAAEEKDEYVVYPTDADYHLVWEENFDQAEAKLKDADWNYEEHEVGWVNHELQEYIPSEEYAFVKDGELVIQPVKNVDASGKVSYVSGRVNTQGKHAYKYGRFEAKIKVPSGQGFLPAFWMMPEDEQYYGQWPKCGEIDIMEVLGNDTTHQYGTLHFGEPHTQRQGIYEDGSDFSKEYHVFAVEYEPGVMRWYVDGKQYFETSDWFTAVDGEEEKPYPAPFNQPFHVILNVAVGGDWPGDPDDSTVFDENAAMYVDYVRIYQKDSYDENVKKPEKVYNFKEADETGNYITNSDFSVAEDLTDDNDWKFLLFNDGAGSAEIKDNEIVITTTNVGTEEYSVQLVQPHMPMVKGEKYKLSFEAYADEPRTLITAVTAPEVDWVRYFPDTKVDLSTEYQTFTFEFDMTKKDDDMGRVEFNMGNQGSTATIHIRNVRLEKVQ